MNKQQIKDEAIEMVLFKTTNYEQFKENPTQPNKRTDSVTSLAKSLTITKGNMLVPIIIDPKTKYIIDGHRRREAARLAQVPLYYIYYEGDYEVLMRLLSTGQKNWSSTQFINHFSYNDDGYAKLQSFLEEEGATIELVKKFTILSQAGIRAGINIDEINYKELHELREAANLIAGTFSLPLTLVHRSISDMKDKLKTIDGKILKEHIERDRKNGKFGGVKFVATRDLLSQILIQSYNRKK